MSTLVEVQYNLRDARVKPEVKFLQYVEIDDEQFYLWMAWTILATINIVVFGLLAVPGGLKVTPEAWRPFPWGAAGVADRSCGLFHPGIIGRRHS